MFSPPPEVLPFNTHPSGHQHPSPIIGICQWHPPQAESPATILPCETWTDTTARVHQDHMPRAERENKSWRNTGQLCIPYQKASPALTTPSSLIFGLTGGLQQQAYRSPFMLSPSVPASAILVPNSTTALPLPGYGPVGPDPNPWTDFSARPWTCLMVPRLCPTLLLSPDLIPTSELPLHHQLHRGSGLWADPSCYPRAHPAHLAWRQ